MQLFLFSSSILMSLFLFILFSLLPLGMHFEGYVLSNNLTSGITCLLITYESKLRDI